MSQTLETEEDRKRRLPSQDPDTEQIATERQEQAYIQSMGYKQVFPDDMKAYFLFVTVCDLFLIAAITAEGATWVFAPVFLGVILTYIFGAFYSLKKLIESAY